MENTLTQVQELNSYANEIGFGSLPLKVLSTITKIRKVFADTITTDINRPYNKQMEDLLKACEDNGIEFVNGEVFGDEDDVGILRIEETLQHPSEDYAVGVLVDVLIGLQLHDMQEDDTDENTFIICTHYADVTIQDNKRQEDVTIQDINSNELAISLKGENVELQINTNVVDYSGRTFVYDGCHKIYVICDEDDRAKAREYGYIVDNSNEESETEHPITEIEEFYIKSCPLRFIQYFNVEREDYNILPQSTDCPMFIYY